jgi:hypothetical protein
MILLISILALLAYDKSEIGKPALLWLYPAAARLRPRISGASCVAW